MSLDFSGNLNINNKLTLTSGDLKVSDSIKSNSGLFEDLTVNNSITFNGSNFDLNSITVKDLSITDNLNVSASNSTFVNEHVDEVWLWFGERAYTPQTNNLINSYTGGTQYV